MAEPRTITKDPEDPAVIAAARAGDRVALGIIFDGYKHMLARWILRMTGDVASVDDLVQEVFVAAFSALPRFRGEASIRSWLRAIATNRVRNWWEAQRRRQSRESQAEGWVADRVVELPDADLEAKRERDRFYRALGSLPHALREAFVARALEGMDLREASAALQVPISTVSWRTRKAEAMLCESLGLPPPTGR